MTEPTSSEDAFQELKKLNIPATREKFLSSVLAGEAPVVKLFLLSGMSPDTADRNGITLLMWAAGKGHAEIVRLLLQQGANVNLQNSKGKTALMSAAYYGRVETLKVLIESGADPGLKDLEEKTAYHWSVTRNYSAIAEILQHLL